MRWPEAKANSAINTLQARSKDGAAKGRLRSHAAMYTWIATYLLSAESGAVLGRRRQEGM